MRIDWSNVPKDVKEKLLVEIYDGIEAPCCEGKECIMSKTFGFDCGKDNDNHCVFRDFIGSCLYVK